jgi:hypothetical protein
MSQVVGMPFCLETMLRSGVPPHIGQSPLPGSDALTTNGSAGSDSRIPNARPRRTDRAAVE